MKFKLSTLILLLVALGFGGGVYFFEVRGASQRDAAQAEQQLFDFKEDQVQAFTVKTKQQTLSFEKANDRTWQLRSKDAACCASPTPANDASVAYLLNLLATGTSDRTLTVSVNQKAEFGLDQPLATVDVRLNNNETHRLILGQPNFNRSFLYAQADPSSDANEELKIRLVSMNFENAVNRPLADWQRQKNQRPSPSKPN